MDTTFQQNDPKMAGTLMPFKEFMLFADTYREDPEFRARVDEDVTSVMDEWGIPFQPGVELRIAENTAEVVHFVLPPDPNVALSDESLGMVAGGKTSSTAGSAGSASTASSVCTTASCAGSASSVGSVGSHGG